MSNLRRQQPIRRAMRTDPLECALWITALALPRGVVMPLTPELNNLADLLFYRYPPSAKA